MSEALTEELKLLIASNRKLAAIKLYRVQTGVGLREAKKAIERMMSDQEDPIQPSLESSVESRSEGYWNSAELQRLLHLGQKIAAIKLYRVQTGVGLREAKKAIERMISDQEDSIRSSRKPSEEPVGSTSAGYVDPDELQRLLRLGQKITAIKYYRKATGVGLKEAKDAVNWLEKQGRR